MNQTLPTSHTDESARPHGEGPKRIAFIQAGWHKDIVDQSRLGFLAELEKLSGDAYIVDVFDVPGAFEIPLQAKLIAQAGGHAAIVAAGLVVDGGIYRHEFVAEAVISGLMRVQLDMEIPIISAVLTPQQFHGHDEHTRYFTEHFVIKGAEAAQACVQTIESVGVAKAMAA